jgi:hypothetical protein
VTVANSVVSDCRLATEPVILTNVGKVVAAKEPSKMAKNPKYQDTKVWQLAEKDKQAEALKTTRLRALRLTKEAADRDAANQATATALPRRQAHQLKRSTPPS